MTWSCRSRSCTGSAGGPGFVRGDHGGADLDEEVGTFPGRTLAEIAYPYVLLDATTARYGCTFGVSQAVVIASGLTAAGAERSSGSMSATPRTRRSGPRLLHSLKVRGLVVSGHEVGASRGGLAWGEPPGRSRATVMPASRSRVGC